jgi:hypothetical protein
VRNKLSTQRRSAGIANTHFKIDTLFIQDKEMTGEEKRYRVTTEYKSIYQIVVEATSPEEAEYFAKDIDLDKWQHIETDFEIVDVSKDFFLKRVKDE